MRRSGAIKTWIWAILALGVLLQGGAASGQDVSPSQRDQLKNWAGQTRRDISEQRNALKRARMDLFGAYQQYNLDDRRVKSGLDRISKLQWNLLNAHLASQIRIREIVNQDQFEKFQSMMKEHHKGSGMFSSSHRAELVDRLPDQAMLEDLDLSQSQMNRLKPYVGLPPRARALISRLQRDSRQLADNYRSYNLDEAGARKLVNSIHDCQRDLAQLNYKKQQALRAVLSEAQFGKLNSAMLSRIKAQREQHDEKPV